MGKVQHYAVFGNPVLHSRSPQLYNSMFIHHKISSFYTRIHVSAGRAVCELIRQLGLSGANVTTPFKEDVIPWIDRLSSGAEKLSAVNTIINRDGTLEGFNTDPFGVTGALKDAGIDPAGRNCMVIGAGGAGKAAVSGLVEAGADVLFTNRTLSRIFEFAEMSGCRILPVGDAVEILRDFDVLVLALPPGIYPFEEKHLHKNLTIVDANYRSFPDDSLLHNFTGKIIRGERWLLHQAIEAYRLFTGESGISSVMEGGMKKDLDLHKLDIGTIRSGKPEIDMPDMADMIVDGRGLENKQINQIIDEEKSKAFGNSG